MMKMVMVSYAFSSGGYGVDNGPPIGGCIILLYLEVFAGIIIVSFVV